jgi:putative polyhydroxyalkanoate system protein
MPKVSMEIPHSLGQEEATQRLKKQLESVRGTVNDLHEQWDGNAMTFRFEAVGMKVHGDIAVEPSALRVNVELPFAAMMLKGVIEQRMRQELTKVLT